MFKSRAWLMYQLKAHYRRGHHVHSPYTYLLFTNVLFERWQYYSFPRIESIRKRIPDTSRASDEPKYTQLLQRLCATNNADTIMEIGRSNGISTMYLASNNSKSAVYSLSDNPQINLFRQSGIKNICQRSFKQLQNTLDEIDHLDLLYVRCSCGVRDIYSLFEACKKKSRDGSIFIFDNIHSDRQTEDEWNEILKSERITLSMDLYRMGLVWFKNDLKKQHYTVKY